MFGTLFAVLGSLWLGTGGAEKVADTFKKPKSSEWATRQMWGDLINSPEGQQALEAAQYFDRYGKAMPERLKTPIEPKLLEGHKIIYRSPKKRGIVVSYTLGGKIFNYYTYGYSYQSREWFPRFSGGSNSYEDAVKYAKECDLE